LDVSIMSYRLIHEAADLIRSSKQLTVLTGAGVSKESGIPTFRDALDGLWAQFDPKHLATRPAFECDPKLVWDFYEFRRELMSPAKPNPAHLALVELETRFPTMQIITQNIDNLHEQAGSKNIIRLHGNIYANKCFFDCQGEPTRVDINQIEWDKKSGPPPCPHCGRWVRPDVVWFGEMLPADHLQRAKAILTYTDVMLVIGTSGVVMPVAEMPYIAKYQGARIIEFNPVESEITPVADVWLQAPAGESLPLVVEAL
jgi:NAD-dependent deacetylase